MSTYETFEGSHLDLVLESSRKAEVEYALSIRLKNGSATCKLNIL